jgi:hypothetical protein
VSRRGRHPVAAILLGTVLLVVLDSLAWLAWVLWHLLLVVVGGVQ